MSRKAELGLPYSLWQNVRKQKKLLYLLLSQHSWALLNLLFSVSISVTASRLSPQWRGALGAAYVVFMNVAANAYGLTGIPMIAIVAPLGMGNLINYLIGMAIAVFVAFITAFFLGIKEDEKKS